jgi:alkylated DNA nucleotide flippase Atl1
MERERLREVVEGIPPGRWMSYADVCVAAGGVRRQALGLNQRLIREGLDGAHRVLKSDGSVAPSALGDPDAVRARLLAEGLCFEAGRAVRAARLEVPGHSAEVSARRS